MCKIGFDFRFQIDDLRFFEPYISKMIKLQYKFTIMSVVLIKNGSPKTTTLKTKVCATDKKIAVKKSAFEIECEKGFTIEESRKRIHDKIDSLWKK